MLQAKALSKVYGRVHALHELNLEVQPGEIFCLLGANGAGKTTTIHLLMGFIKPSSGTALVNGLDVSQNLADCRQLLAYIPEHVNLYEHLSGRENLAYFSSLSGQQYSKNALTDLLRRSGLQDQAHDRYVATYSKGMRQKVGIAIALAKQAKALLLDEPTSGLDPAAANDFSQLLLDLKRSGMAVLMASHDLFRCRQVGDRVGIMKQGKLVEERAATSLSAQALEALYINLMGPESAPAEAAKEPQLC